MKKELSGKQRDALSAILQARFEKFAVRHPRLEWAGVRQRLEAAPGRLWSLQEMERTGGEPDVVGYGAKSGEYTFFDCAAESPKGRTGLCYDLEGRESRKEHRPESSALEMAGAMGVAVLSEDQYFQLQQLGEFDTRTSSWLLTPPEIRRRGGAIFGDRRFGRVFIYHNGAQSYYSVRGFRAVLRVEIRNPGAPAESGR